MTRPVEREYYSLTLFIGDKDLCHRTAYSDHDLEETCQILWDMALNKVFCNTPELQTQDMKFIRQFLTSEINPSAIEFAEV